VPPVGFTNGINQNTDVEVLSMASPSACTLGNLIVAVNNFTAAGSDTTTITVYHNQGATTLACSVTSNGNRVACTDTTHTVSVSQGDLLAIAFVETNANPFNAITVTMTCQ
jgi:hypothetical protein